MTRGTSVIDPLMTSIDGNSAFAVERLLQICFPTAETLYDPTYGNGGFYKNSSRKVLGSDLDPARAKDFVASYEELPLPENAIDVVVFDPPFQPSTSHKTEGIISRRFRTISASDGSFGHGAMDRLKDSVQLGAVEAQRVGRLGCILKVQDYIHSGRPVWMSLWVHEMLGEPFDFLTLRVPSKLKAPNWTRQLSVWRNHSTFWVYKKKGNRR